MHRLFALSFFNTASVYRHTISRGLAAEPDFLKEQVRWFCPFNFQLFGNQEMLQWVIFSLLWVCLEMFLDFSMFFVVDVVNNCISWSFSLIVPFSDSFSNGSSPVIALPQAITQVPGYSFYWNTYGTQYKASPVYKLRCLLNENVNNHCS